jgi:transcription elongation factor Elf1
MSSGVNVVEMDWTWECPECKFNNEDVTVYAEGDTANATCTQCGQETEVNV